MLRFTADHEWLRIDGDVAVVGITEHAQEQLGDLVFVELPASGKSFEKGAPAAVVESVKAAFDVYSPISGQVVETNETIVSDPTIVNSDPLGNGWFFKLKIAEFLRDRLSHGRKDIQGAARVEGVAMQSNRLMRSSMDVTVAERAFDPFSFAQRHIGPQAHDVRGMLQVVNAPSLNALIDEAMPRDIRQRKPLSSGSPLSEPELLAKMWGIAARNQAMVSLIGQGYYGTHLPAVIQRNVLENPAWYTAYTPYQAEISQGRLEALLNFQTMIADLTGLEIANASLLDEATAAAEGMAMARRIAPSQASAFFVDHDCHPQTVAVIQTRAEPLGWTVVVGDPAADLDPASVFGAILQYPGSCGGIRDYRDVIRRLHAAEASAIVAADPLALTLLMSPGELGADIAVGSTQRFGVPMGYGGPHAGFIAAQLAFQRALPGRIVGVSVDSRGRPAYRLALQTREQHIRREKATSNICTAQVLPAVLASMYGVYHGADGLRQIASRVAHTAATLARGLQNRGWAIPGSHYFDTITVDTGAETEAILARALAGGINLRQLDARLAISCDETTTAEIVEAVWAAFGAKASIAAGDNSRSFAAVATDVAPGLPGALRRTRAFMSSSGICGTSIRNRDAPLFAPVGGSRSGARPNDDSIGFLHDETQCRRRDDAPDLARYCRSASICAKRAGARLPGDDRRPRGQVARDLRV